MYASLPLHTVTACTVPFKEVPSSTPLEDQLLHTMKRPLLDILDVQPAAAIIVAAAATSIIAQQHNKFFHLLNQWCSRRRTTSCTPTPIPAHLQCQKSTDVIVIPLISIMCYIALLMSVMEEMSMEEVTTAVLTQKIHYKNSRLMRRGEGDNSMTSPSLPSTLPLPVPKGRRPMMQQNCHHQILQLPTSMKASHH